MAKKLYADKAMELMDAGEMLPDDKGVYHAIGDEPINWYNTESDICRSCGTNKRYSVYTKCLNCTRIKKITQFKLCPNYEDPECKSCVKVIPAGYRLAKDNCAGCEAISKRAVNSDGMGLCCVCQQSKTKKRMHDIPVCAKCLQKSKHLVMEKVDMARFELDESMYQFSPKNGPLTSARVS